jgi:hypothetical protein
MANFMERARAGEIPPDALEEELEKAVESWHGDTDVPAQALHEFLGFTYWEYARWAVDPDSLQDIVNHDWDPRKVKGIPMETPEGLREELKPVEELLSKRYNIPVSGLKDYLSPRLRSGEIDEDNLINQWTYLMTALDEYEGEGEK